MADRIPIQRPDIVDLKIKAEPEAPPFCFYRTLAIPRIYDIIESSDRELSQTVQCQPLFRREANDLAQDVFGTASIIDLEDKYLSFRAPIATARTAGVFVSFGDV